MTEPYAVLGATGAQGGAVVAALLERKLPVRGLARRTQSPRAAQLAEAGVQMMAADLDDLPSLTRAFTGVAGVFALTTPFEEGVAAEVHQGRQIIAAARAAAVPHLVFSSVANADKHTGIPHFESKALVEVELSASPVPHTIIGPTYFYDNLLGGFDALETGKLDLAVPPDVPLQQLSRRDLGRFAAAILADPAPYAGRRIDIASDNPTPRQMATILGERLGVPITVRTLNPRLIANPDMRAMFTFLSDSGYTADIAALHRDHPGIGWQSFADWVRETFSTS